MTTNDNPRASWLSRVFGVPSTSSPSAIPIAQDRAPAAEPRLRPWMIGTDGLAMRQCNQAVQIASRTVDPGPPR